MRELTTALDHARTLIEALDADQWDRPTPCSGWSVRQLVNHLVSGQVFFAQLLTGEPFEAALALRDRDNLGDDPVEAYRQSAEALLIAADTPGALERPVQLPIGTVPGVVALHLRVVECLVHGWDLARATGQRFDVPDDLVEGELAFTRGNLPAIPPERTPFGPPQPVSDEAVPLDRLAALLGRPVDWSPAET